MEPYILGLDVGGTKCAAVLAKAGRKIEILRRKVMDTRAQEGFDTVWERLIRLADSLLAQCEVQPDMLRAIGVSCGGPLDSARGVVLCPPNLPGWVNIPVTRLLEEHYGVPAFLQNDAKACALVEWTLGAGRGSRNMLFLTMGTGFGCGMIANGELLTGANDMCGEIGHIRLAEDGPVGFGKAGSIEGFCSGGGIARLMLAETENLLQSGVTPAWVQDGVPESEYSAKLLAQYAQNNEVHALALWERVGEQLGRALAILIDAFNPECIVIGSIFVRCEHLLRPAMERALEQEAIAISRSACRVIPAAAGEQLGDLAAVIAACHPCGILPCHNRMPPKAQQHVDLLLNRYPVLQPQREAICHAYELLAGSFACGGKLLICGNGGSAADAEHIVGELMKEFQIKRPLCGSIRRKAERALGKGVLNLQQALPAIALTQHSALSTAFSNDASPEYVFAQQVLGYGRRGDALLAISTSGSSQNVVAAAKLAGALGLRTIALTGPNSGALGACCEAAILCPGNSTAEIQELHLPVYHALCAMLEITFFDESTNGGV